MSDSPDRPEESPQRPEDLIDPRWYSTLRPRTAQQPATGVDVSTDDLNTRIRAIVHAWQQGEQGPRATLAAFRALADEVL